MVDAVQSQPQVYGRADAADLLAECYRHRDPAARNRRAVVMVHGGAWTSNDRHTPVVVCEDLARHGFTVFSLDFRDGRNGKHPCAVQDITAGIRHVRANAADLDVDPDAIGLIGSSSGGHLVLLAAIQPDIEAHRGTAVDLGGTLGDASDVSAAVSCVVALWPVSDPLVRFRYAQDVGREELVAAHLRYYDDEEHMHAASVQRALCAGEAERTPPLLLVQPGEDANVPRRDDARPSTRIPGRRWRAALPVLPGPAARIRLPGVRGDHAPRGRDPHVPGSARRC